MVTFIEFNLRVVISIRHCLSQLFELSHIFRGFRKKLYLLIYCYDHFPMLSWVHCHHGMARPRVTDRGDGLQIWRVAANMLNKQSRTADSGWSSSLGVGRGANSPPPQNSIFVTNHYAQPRNTTDYLAQPKHRKMDIDLGEIGLGCVDWIRLAQDRDRWRAVVIAVINLRVLAPRS
jgi:hypothetical protein